MSLARNHFQKHSAKAAAQAATEFGTMQNRTIYELHLAQLNNDRQRLKQVQAMAGKIQLKQTLIPNYIAYVDGILDADKSIQDEVFMTILVWCIDVENYEKTLEMAAFALKHNMIMPDRFKRTTNVLVTEEIAEAFLKRLKTEATIDIAVLQRLEKLVIDTDMPNQVKSKLTVALGRANIKLIQDFDEPTALDLEYAKTAQAYLTEAIELDDRCGAKADAKKLENLIKKFPIEPRVDQELPTEQAEPLLNANGSQVVDDQGSLAFKTT